MGPPSASSSPAAAPRRSAPTMRLRREALESVLEELRRALDELRECGELGVPLPDPEGAVNDGGGGEEQPDNEEEGGGGGGSGGGNDDDSAASLAGGSDGETDKLCDLLKSTFESPNFFQKVDEIQKSLYQNDAVEQDPSWDIVKAVDLWEDDDLGDGYVLVKNDDATEGMAFFIATYISSLKTANECSPDQIRKVLKLLIILLPALKKTFSSRKRKGKLRKAWNGTKVIYNVDSWSATAIGIYHNQAILKVATTAFRTSCSVISKFL
ncbi:hypothetical protein OsJ_29673 [Oryza sativa Japonica Group]|uniref:Uncharacterized protein n=1 Tax=Oryza sativa subsp. japonica TaxID=39947 RepID=A3BZP6_ORYSJ|nr:hypothetical protein OsJ_29673 [Oryza sativa Japonica Group]